MKSVLMLLILVSLLSVLIPEAERLQALSSHTVETVLIETDSRFLDSALSL